MSDDLKWGVRKYVHSSQKSSIFAGESCSSLRKRYDSSLKHWQTDSLVICTCEQWSEVDARSARFSLLWRKISFGGKGQLECISDNEAEINMNDSSRSLLLELADILWQLNIDNGWYVVVKFLAIFHMAMFEFGSLPEMLKTQKDFSSLHQSIGTEIWWAQGLRWRSSTGVIWKKSKFSVVLEIYIGNYTEARIDGMNWKSIILCLIIWEL